MSTYLLVHGAWHGAWCWRQVTPLLERAGHRVIAPDLPGSGQDRTPLAEVSLAVYVERLTNLVDQADEPIILVGHSMGGMIISQVAEERPERITRLVYLAALLPQDGESAMQIASLHPKEASLPELTFDEKAGVVRLRFPSARRMLYQDCPPADVALAERSLRPQALAPLRAPVHLSERFERVPRAYIACAADQAIAPAMQERFYTRTPCEGVASLPSGHSPFFSLPERLVIDLLALTRQERKQADPFHKAADLTQGVERVSAEQPSLAPSSAGSWRPAGKE